MRFASRTQVIGRASRHASREGFTLIEILVSFAVLALILVLTSQFISDTTTIIQHDNRRMDAFAAARAVLDRLSLDWDNRAGASSASPAYDKIAGDDALSFYSRTPAYEGGDRSVPSHVGYRMRSHPVHGRALERAAIGENWFDGATPVAFPPTPDVAIDETEFSRTGQGIIRFELGFLVVDTGTGAWTWRVAPPAPGSAESLRAIVAFLVSVDSVSIQTIPASDRTGLLNNLAAQFPDSGDLTNPAEVWEAVAANAPALAQAANVPLPVAQSIRVFQRLLTIE